MEEFLHTLRCARVGRAASGRDDGLPPAVRGRTDAGTGRPAARRRGVGACSRPIRKRGSKSFARKRATRALSIPDAVLKSLANSLRGNVRELEGAVNSVSALREGDGPPGGHEHRPRGARRPVAARGSCCDRRRRGRGRVCGPAAGKRHASVEGAVVGREPPADDRDLPLPQAHRRDATARSANTSRAKTHSTAVAAEKKVRGWIEKELSVAIGDRDWPVKGAD